MIDGFSNEISLAKDNYYDVRFKLSQLRLPQESNILYADIDESLNEVKKYFNQANELLLRSVNGIKVSTNEVLEND